MEGFRIHLEAIAPRLGCARSYDVVADKDLFGHIIVALTWGRIGTRGREQVLSAATLVEAQRLVRTRLARRSSLKRRLGAAYRVRHVAGDASWVLGIPLEVRA
jgi:hypothetical protein